MANETAVVSSAKCTFTVFIKLYRQPLICRMSSLVLLRIKNLIVIFYSHSKVGKMMSELTKMNISCLCYDLIFTIFWLLLRKLFVINSGSFNVFSGH